MTPRERFLLHLLWIAIGISVFVGTVGLLSEVWADQDRALIQAKQAVRRLLEKPTGPSSPPLPVGLLLAKDQAGSASSMARDLQKTLGDEGLEVLEFQILTDTPEVGWVRFHLRGPITPWLSFLRQSAPGSQRLFRNVAIRIYENTVYDYTLEVGYARTP